MSGQSTKSLAERQLNISSDLQAVASRLLACTSQLTAVSVNYEDLDDAGIIINKCVAKLRDIIDKTEELKEETE